MQAPTILVVDDEQHPLSLTERLTARYRVLEAETAAAALARVKKASIWFSSITGSPTATVSPC